MTDGSRIDVASVEVAQDSVLAMRPRQYEIARQSSVRFSRKMPWGRSERITLILCRMSLGHDRSYDWFGALPRQRMGWKQWRAAGYPEQRETMRYTRDAPLPRWERVSKNQCPVCGQPTFQDGAWWPEAGPPRWNKQWHSVCATAYQAWHHADFLAHSLAIRQSGVCPETGEAILRERERRVFRDGVHVVEQGQVLVGGVEVDHRVPLWRVRRDAHLYGWPDVLRFWGPSNLQALSARGHKLKCAREARERSGRP